MGKSPEPKNELLLIGYARVSTEDQNLNLQIDALRAAGVHDDHIHCEKLSARKKNRPELDMAIKDLRPGETLVVWRIDRLARNMQDLYERLAAIRAAGGKFRSLQEDFDFGSYMGEFVLGIFGLVAQLESQITQHRTKAGMEAWRARGGKPGREREFTDAMQGRAVKMVRGGTKVRAACEKLKISAGTFYNYYRVKRTYTGKGKKRVAKITVTKRQK